MNTIVFFVLNTFNIIPLKVRKIWLSCFKEFSPRISGSIHIAYIGEYLHFRYLKCLVNICRFQPFLCGRSISKSCRFGWWFDGCWWFRRSPKTNFEDGKNNHQWRCDFLKRTCDFPMNRIPQMVVKNGDESHGRIRKRNHQLNKSKPTRRNMPCIALSNNSPLSIRPLQAPQEMPERCSKDISNRCLGGGFSPTPSENYAQVKMGGTLPQFSGWTITKYLKPHPGCTSSPPS